MTDKQIIIDGVDVSGCEYCGYDNVCKLKSASNYIVDCKEHPNCNYKQLERLKEHHHKTECEASENLKKLVKLEQECEKAKQNAQDTYELYQALMESFNILQGEKIKLEQECKELKKTVDDLLHKPEIQDKIVWKIDNEALLGSKEAWIYKLEQTLIEIKEIAEANKNYKFKIPEICCAEDTLELKFDVLEQILQKINEVEKNV